MDKAEQTEPTAPREPLRSYLSSTFIELFTKLPFAPLHNLRRRGKEAVRAFEHKCLLCNSAIERTLLTSLKHYCDCFSLIALPGIFFEKYCVAVLFLNVH